MTESYNRDLLLLELGDLNAKINDAVVAHASTMAVLMAERKALIARINKPAQITITARMTPEQWDQFDLRR